MTCGAPSRRAEVTSRWADAALSPGQVWDLAAGEAAPTSRSVVESVSDFGASGACALALDSDQHVAHSLVPTTADDPVAVVEMPAAPSPAACADSDSDSDVEAAACVRSASVIRRSANFGAHQAAVSQQPQQPVHKPSVIARVGHDLAAFAQAVRSQPGGATTHRTVSGLFPQAVTSRPAPAPLDVVCGAPTRPEPTQPVQSLQPVQLRAAEQQVMSPVVAADVSTDPAQALTDAIDGFLDSHDDALSTGVTPCAADVQRRVASLEMAVESARLAGVEAAEVEAGSGLLRDIGSSHRAREDLLNTLTEKGGQTATPEEIREALERARKASVCGRDIARAEVSLWKDGLQREARRELAEVLRKGAEGAEAFGAAVSQASLAGLSADNEPLLRLAQRSLERALGGDNTAEAMGAWHAVAAAAKSEAPEAQRQAPAEATDEAPVLGRVRELLGLEPPAPQGVAAEGAGAEESVLARVRELLGHESTPASDFAPLEAPETLGAAPDSGAAAPEPAAEAPAEAAAETEVVRQHHDGAPCSRSSSPVPDCPPPDPVDPQAEQSAEAGRAAQLVADPSQKAASSYSPTEPNTVAVTAGDSITILARDATGWLELHNLRTGEQGWAPWWIAPPPSSTATGTVPESSLASSPTKRLREIERELETATWSTDIGQLERAVAAAHGAGVSGPSLSIAERVLEREATKGQALGELDSAVASGDEDLLRAAVAKAKAAGVSAAKLRAAEKELSAFRGLVYEARC